MGGTDTEPIIYLDYNASAPLRPQALTAMTVAFGIVGNASSAHRAGRAAAEAVERARGQVAMMLGCSPGEVVFTSGATEANNIAIRSAASPDQPLAISAAEHPAVAEAAAAVATQRGLDIRTIGIEADGTLSMGELHTALSENPSLLSIMAANNETGVLNGLSLITKLAHDSGAVLHSDATQLIGRLPVDVRELDVDLLSLSAHKFGGPQGVGALYVKRGLSIQPLSFGGGHERGRRPGTLNVAGIVGMGAAAEAVTSLLSQEVPGITALRDRLETGVFAAVPGVTRNGRVDRRLPGVSSMTFPGAPAEAVLAAMPFVAASEGSACTAGAPEPSRVLTAMGLRREEAECTIRFSLGYATTAAEIDRAITHIEEAVRRVRGAMNMAGTSYGRPNIEPAGRIIG